MKNGHEMFHYPGSSLRFPTKEGTRAPLPLEGATIPTTMSPNDGSSKVRRPEKRWEQSESSWHAC